MGLPLSLLLVLVAWVIVGLAVAWLVGGAIRLGSKSEEDPGWTRFAESGVQPPDQTYGRAFASGGVPIAWPGGIDSDRGRSRRSEVGGAGELG